MHASLPGRPSHQLDGCFRRVCLDRRSAVAVHNLADGHSLTFAALYEQSEAIGRALRELHIGPGMPVVTRVGNHSVFFPLFAACMNAGVALVALGEVTDEEAGSIVASCDAAAIVTDRQPPIASLARVTLGGLQIAALRPRRSVEVYGESVVLKLTSGSTNLPKAALAGIHHLVNDGRHVIEAMGIGADDINLACIPLSHSYALGNIVMPLLLQGTRVALRQSFNPSQFTADVASAGATVFPGVPFMFDRLRGLDVDRLPASLRLLITAGARVDPATVVWFRQTLARKIHSFLGSSETGGIAYDETDEVTEPINVGRPMPETSVEIRHADATGAGRIFVAGTAVAASYAQDRATPQDAGFAGDADDEAVAGFVDGGFQTGDVGYFGDGGRLVLTGRLTPSINVAGLKVNPSEIERVLRELPGVEDVRVMGASCDRRGQQLVAFLVSDQSLTSVDIRQRCAQTLSPHKIPRQFIFLDQLPLDARGKMDRRALEALAAEGPA